MIKKICRTAAWVFLSLVICPPAAPVASVLTFSTVKGAHFKGPIVEVMTQAYHRLGIAITLAELPTQRSLMDAGQGIYDGELFRIQGIDRVSAALIMVDVPCFELDVYLYTSKQKRFIVAGWESIPQGYTMVAPFAVKYIDKCIKTHNIPTFFVKKPEETLGFLLSGKADFTLSTPTLDRWLIARGLDNDLIRLTPAVDRIQLFHYLHKKNAALVKPVARVLKQMHRDGSITRIQSRWENTASGPGAGLYIK